MKNIFKLIQVQNDKDYAMYNRNIARKYNMKREYIQKFRP